MDRRGFLKSLAALAVTAVAAPALATVALEPNKYEEAIRLYDITVAARDDVKTCNQRFNELLKFLHTNFTTECNPKTIAAAAALLKSEDIQGWRKVPPTVIDEIYPVALARMALKFDRLPISPTKLTEFDTFHKRYGKTIISATA